MSNFLTIACFFSFFGLNTATAAVDAQANQAIQQHVDFYQTSATYTWSNIGHASSFIIVLTPRGSGSQITFASTTNHISLLGVADGTYRVTVYGVFSNKNSFVIVQDVIVIGGTKAEYPTTPPTVQSEDI